MYYTLLMRDSRMSLKNICYNLPERNSHMKESNIRTAGYSDAALLADTRISQLNDEEKHPDGDIRETLIRWFEKMLKEKSLYQVIIEDDAGLAATGGLITLPFPASFFEPQGNTGYILNIYTRPDVRKQGYGSCVMDLLKEEAKRQNMEVLYLYSSVHGRRLYEKAGFEKSEEWMSLYL